MIFQPIGSHPKPKPIQTMGWKRTENLVKICEKIEENIINRFNPNMIHINQELGLRIRLEMRKMEACTTKTRWIIFRSVNFVSTH